jgi:hypothetical protein
MDLNRFAQRLTNSPFFIAGAFKGPRDQLAQVGQTLGIPGNYASVNQMYDKILNSTVLDGIRSMAGTGPVRVAEMEVIKRASGDRQNQPGAIRAVLVMQQRAYEKQIDISHIVQAHGGIIDDAAASEIDQVMQRPLFKPEELTDWRALGAPTFNSPAEALAAGLPHRSPVRTTDGRVKYTP